MSDHMPSKRSKLLPENAYRKLNPGEEYKPIVAPEDTRAEVTPFSIGLGLIMVIIFSAACVYIALRAGNGIEAAIPIAILAIFFGKLKSQRSTILENVIVQSVGQASGVVAAGAAFLVPAIYLNSLTPAWWHIVLACFIGGTLGVVLIIPLRKYFVKDLHGELPFPEATAVNEILCSGESSGPTAGKVLIIAFLLGGFYDFIVEGLHLWSDEVSTTEVLGSFGAQMSDMRFEIKISALAALFGLGYIIGLKYASIIAAGSVLAFVVMVPFVYLFGQHVGEFDFAGTVHSIKDMSAGKIFSTFVKPIGIGAIALSGLIGIIRMGNIVVGSISLGFKGFGSGAGQSADEPRTQYDMHPRNVLLIQFAMAILMAVLFFAVAKSTVNSATGELYTMGDSVMYAVIGAVVGFILSFLFTPVAAQAIAIVGVNPVSGMTLITVVLTILVLVAFGLKGEGGMFVALVVGTAVCTALSTSGALISDFKIGYWIGATPREQQRWKFLGVALAALVVAAVIPIMDSSYHFLVEDPDTGQMISNEKQLPAPQANMIAAVAKGLLTDPASQPWLLYGLGAIVAILLYMAGVPMLAFALGMYLPIGINMAVLAGAFSAWIISKTGGSERVRKARSEQGILIASGMMAGAAIFGILVAVLRLPDIGSPIQYISMGKEYKVADGQLEEMANVVAIEFEASEAALNEIKADAEKAQLKILKNAMLDGRLANFVDRFEIEKAGMDDTIKAVQQAIATDQLAEQEKKLKYKVIDGNLKTILAALEAEDYEPVLLALKDGSFEIVRVISADKTGVIPEAEFEALDLKELTPSVKLKMMKEKVDTFAKAFAAETRKATAKAIKENKLGKVLSAEEYTLVSAKLDAIGKTITKQQAEKIAKAKEVGTLIPAGEALTDDALSKLSEQIVSGDLSLKVVALNDGKLRVIAKGTDYYHEHGEIISFLALVGLALSCYLLASWGAKGTLAEEDEAEGGEQ